MKEGMIDLNGHMLSDARASWAQNKIAIPGGKRVNIFVYMMRLKIAHTN